MISPDTPPGTEVICIDASDGPFGPSRLTKGAIYTVKMMRKGVTREWLVMLEEVKTDPTYLLPWGEITVGYRLDRFRYLDIPKQLTQLLEEKYERLDMLTRNVIPAHSP